MEDRRQRWVWVAFCVALATAPFLVVEFVPSTDLPQHLGQLRLFGEAWGSPDGPLTVQWWTPYGLVYGLLAVPWLLFSPVVAGKVGLWLIVALQIAAVHLLAARWQRPIAATILASAFVFHDQLYWGFLNYLFGFVVFAAWFALSRRHEEADLRRPVRTAGLFLLAAATLYLSHALWFAFGLLWLGVEALISRRSLANLLWRAAGVAPVAVTALIWFTALRSTDFASPPEWVMGPLPRLHPLFLPLAGLGGLRHPVEGFVVLGAILWVLAAIIGRRREKYFGCDPYFLALAVMLFGLYLFLPDKFSNTIRFSTRWLPYCFVFLCLAVGRPRISRLLRRATAVVLLTSFMVVTVSFWRAFEAIELDGLGEALAAIEEDSRVIGLSYLERSRFLNGQRPFLQIYSWAYAIHGGTLNFSFGDFAPSLVVYKEGGERRGEWTKGLEWFPKMVRRSDFLHFDYALIGGAEEAHQMMVRVDLLKPVAAEGIWRLYRIEPPAPAEASPSDSS